MSHDDQQTSPKQTPAATTGAGKNDVDSDHDAPATAGANDKLFPRRAADSGTSGLVHTQWFVDYATVAGTSTKIPQRKDTQLIVEELKIFPKAADYAKVLKGGNMAKSGAVSLGGVDVARGAGDVSASVRYSPKSGMTRKADCT